MFSKLLPTCLSLCLILVTWSTFIKLCRQKKRSVFTVLSVTVKKIWRTVLVISPLNNFLFQRVSSLTYKAIAVGLKIKETGPLAVMLCSNKHCPQWQYKILFLRDITEISYQAFNEFKDTRLYHCCFCLCWHWSVLQIHLSLISFRS